MRTRLAPTPSGYLHLGNAVSFVITWLWARAHQGQVHLRIDDLDQARLRAPYVDDIFEQLRWLGLDWDSGPQNAQDLEARCSQLLRLPLYQSYFERLRAGHHLYFCECTRSQLRRAGGGIYPGTCRDLGKSPEGSGNWRFRVSSLPEPLHDVVDTSGQVDLTQLMGDFVVFDSKLKPAYQLASVVDDALDGIDFVVRGADLRPTTAAQKVLARALNLPLAQTPTLHHPLLRAHAETQKLSKSHGALSLMQARARGLSPADVYRRTALALCLEPAESLEKLLQSFQAQRLIERGFNDQDGAWLL